MENKKTIIASIIGVALLVVLVVGATFAYFTTVTSNDDGETLVTGKTDAIGSISLTNPTGNLHITLNAIDMAQDNLGTYWATNDSTLNYDETEVQRDIAVATLTGGEATTHYECSTTINVSVSGTMVAGLQTGDAYIQFGGLLTNKVDLKNVSTTGYPVTFALNGTDKLSDKVSVSLAIENRNVNQNSIAGKELSVTFSNADLVCKVVETSNGEVEDEIIPEGAEAFAIYSETDKSLRFYNNLDTVNVGDTYNDLKVTAKYTGIGVATGDTEAPWWNYANVIEKVVVENKITPTNMDFWFSYMSQCREFQLAKLDVSNATSMSRLFVSSSLGDSEVVVVGLKAWDFSSIHGFGDMFNNIAPNASTCTLDLSGWDLSGAYDIPSFYQACQNASSISFDLSDWNTSSVTDMSNKFSELGENATELSLDLSGWNTSNVTNMSYMFNRAGYKANYTLDLSDWNVSKVTDYYNFNNGVEGKVIAPSFGTTS